MSDLTGVPGELRFTLTIKRKATGAIETYDMIGRVTPGDEQKEMENGGNSQHGGEKRGD